MTREEIDKLWNRAIREAIEDGNMCTRYHFAALVAAAEREACAKVCDDLADASNLVYAGTAAMHCADAIRARGQA